MSWVSQTLEKHVNEPLTDVYQHTSVMMREVLSGYDFTNGSVVCDCTLGGAGHSLEIAKRIDPDGLLIGIDQDDMALEVAGKRLKAFAPHLDTRQCKGNFSQLDHILCEQGISGVDCFLFDLGVSSPQLDIPERGFSYNHNALLDMRMDPGNQSLDAAEIINTYNEADLTRLLRDFSDERFASRIAKKICLRREKSSIKTTFELVEIIKEAIPASQRRGGGHPAKRTFQALRIAVNDELGALQTGLESAIRWLVPQGRIIVISYHSLEDKIVKKIFKDFARTCTCPPDMPVCSCNARAVLKLVNGLITPAPDEIEVNNRARSAKMRIAEKCSEQASHLG